MNDACSIINAPPSAYKMVDFDHPQQYLHQGRGGLGGLQLFRGPTSRHNNLTIGKKSFRQATILKE
jgi:hypothetical protein